MGSQKDEAPNIGRLSVFGVASEWQACLLAPRRYIALDDVVTDSHSLTQGIPLSELPANGVERSVVVTGQVSSAAQYDPQRKRTNITLRLKDGALCRLMAFGHPNQYPGDWRRQGSHLHVAGKLIVKPDGFSMLFAPQPIPPEFIGRAMGVYPGKTRSIKPETTRDRVLALLTDEHLSEALEKLKHALRPYAINDILAQWGEQRGYRGMTEDSLYRALRCLHYPKTIAQGELSKALFNDLSALSMLIQADRDRPTSRIVQRVVTSPAHVASRIDRMSHTPTAEQAQAMSDMLADMASGQQGHRLLSGDVGTGKTTVFALLASAVHDAGGRVAILLPSEDMVEQVSREIHSWWPDIAMDKVTGRTPKDADLRAPLRLGTTALLHRQRNDWHPTLTVVDEQQKYSAEQRHALVSQGGHLLECTATCLPRTMAQMQFGLLPISRLTTPHTPKEIATAQWDTHDRPAIHGLFQDVKETLAGGEQVLVIFAARDEKDVADLTARAVDGNSNEQPAGGPGVLSLEEGIERWRKALGADAVVGLHGKMKAKDRKASLRALRDGKASVLCATSAAEVGLDLPALRHVVIHNPERFGLVTLHQIRGRVARKGGWGRCDLLQDTQRLSEAAVERLNAFASTQDGFLLAEMDMRQRGMGSLMIQNHRQSGDADAGLLVGERPDIEHFEHARALLDNVNPSSQVEQVEVAPVHPVSVSPLER